MKKIIILLSLYLPILANAQKFYVKSNTGIADKLGYRYGNFINAGLGVGYKLHQNISIETNLNYFSNFDKNRDRFHQSRNGINFSSSKRNLQFLLFNPAIVISTNREKVNFYNRFGISLGFGNYRANIRNSNFAVSNDTTMFHSSHTREKANGGFAYGINDAIGIKIKLNERFSLFGEGIFNFIKYKANERRHVVSQYPTAYNYSYSKNLNMSFSNIGLNAGLIFLLSKNKTL